VKLYVAETTDPEGFWIQAFKQYFVPAKTPNLTSTNPLLVRIVPIP